MILENVWRTLFPGLPSRPSCGVCPGPAQATQRRAALGAREYPRARGGIRRRRGRWGAPGDTLPRTQKVLWNSYPRNTSAWRMVVEKRYAFCRGEKDYGGTPTSQADTAWLLVDCCGTARYVRARVGGQSKGDGPGADAATNPILCW